MRRQLLVAAVCSLLTASCGGSTSDVRQPIQVPKTACVQEQNHSSICGLKPPARRVEGGEAYKVTTVLGESFWVILPDELISTAEVVAIPGVPAPVAAGLSTATARQVADWECGDFPSCKPEAVTREELPSGAVLTRWEDASGTILDLDLTTLELGTWTLELSHPDARLAERFARALKAEVDEDGYPRLASTDPEVRLHADWDRVVLWVPSPGTREDHQIEVIPGCELTEKEPDLGGADAGPELELHEPDTVAGGHWCVEGRYWVDVAFVDRPRLARFHQRLRIVPALD